MKITKNPNIKTKEEIKREKANEGCYACPVCRETELLNDNLSLLEDIYNMSQNGYHPYPNKGIQQVTVQHMYCWRSYTDRYKCYTCGAEWESRRGGGNGMIKISNRETAKKLIGKPVFVKSDEWQSEWYIVKDILEDVDENWEHYVSEKDKGDWLQCFSKDDGYSYVYFKVDNSDSGDDGLYTCEEILNQTI